ncbi:urease accessory protein UreF [Paracoccaceae bacterium GXU_MW_L88]
MPIATDATLLLAQWLSPAFPVGAFSYSHGLEVAIAQGDVVDAGSLDIWLTDILRHGGGWIDAVLIRAAMSDPIAAAEEARARSGAKERLFETEQLGAAFCAQLRNVWGLDLPDCPYPVAFGIGVAELDLPPTQAISMYLHAFAGNLISAAQRLMPLGQTDAQAMLNRLAQICQSLAKESEGTTLDDIATACFAGDIAAMRHETLSPRIFRT